MGISVNIIRSGAIYIGITTITIYIGALIVLITFGVMMMNEERREDDKEMKRSLPAIIIIGGCTTWGISNKLSDNGQKLLNWEEEIGNKGEIKGIGETIFTGNGVIVWWIGMILLIGMVGAITLTLEGEKDKKRQEIESQIRRWEK